eukprot:3132582-Amphidinium_carterae.1
MPPCYLLICSLRMTSSNLLQCRHFSLPKPRHWWSVMPPTSTTIAVAGGEALHVKSGRLRLERSTALKKTECLPTAAPWGERRPCCSDCVNTERKQESSSLLKLACAMDRECEFCVHCYLAQDPTTFKIGRGAAA